MCGASRRPRRNTPRASGQRTARTAGPAGRSLVRPLAAAARARGHAPAVLFSGLLLRVLLTPEDDLAILRVDEDRVALLELAGQDLLRERIDDEPLDRALDRARAVDRVEALLRDQRLRVV